MSDRDFDFEPQPGIPAPLPQGETILWQGSPDAATLARDAYKIRWITGYMLLIALWRATAGWADGGMVQAVATLIPYLGLAAAVFVVLRLIAQVQARASIYTLTTSRAILRIGAALPVTYTIPYACIDGAFAAVAPDNGTGTIALQTRGDMRLSHAVLWPHVRPGHLRQPQPAFRAVPDAARVARILADAAEAKVNEPRISVGPQPGLVAAE